MPGELIGISWSSRRSPLQARGVAARGDVALRLVHRMVRSLGPWRGVISTTSHRALVVLGDALPWVDGVVYLGVDPRAPSLWFDTRLTPDVPLDWLERRLGGGGPMAWLHQPDLLVPLQEAEPFDPTALQAWSRS